MLPRVYGSVYSRAISINFGCHILLLNYHGTMGPQYTHKYQFCDHDSISLLIRISINTLTSCNTNLYIALFIYNGNKTL